MNSITSSSSLLLSFPATSSSSSSSSTNFPKLPSYPSPSASRFLCKTQNQASPNKDLPFVLHHALSSSGINVSHAKEAREGYCKQLERLSGIERETSISINRRVDLAKTALFIAAEDDALVSHSSVALPVGDFVERLYDLSMGFCKHSSSSLRSPPEVFLGNLESYLYGFKILRNLKEAYWPFRHDPSVSLFLRAAWAAKCTSGLNTVEETGFERASAKAAQHRLERGIWTSVRLGDMRRALSASERLILLDHDSDELRDYSILLYHCGFYEQSLHFLSLYNNSMTSLEKSRSSNKLKKLEDDAVEKLKTRLNLILMEDSSTRPSPFRDSLENTSEPW